MFGELFKFLGVQPLKSPLIAPMPPSQGNASHCNATRILYRMQYKNT